MKVTRVEGAMRRGIVVLAALAMIGGAGYGVGSALAALPYGGLFSASPFPPTSKQFVRNVACFTSNTYFGITGRPFFPRLCPPSPSGSRRV